MKKGYCSICGSDNVMLKVKNEKIWPSGREGKYSMCEWCYNCGAYEPLPNCSEKNQRIGELSRGLRYLHSLLTAKPRLKDGAKKV